MEKFEKNINEFPLSDAFYQLQKTSEILKKIGLEVIDDLITEDELAKELPFPIVRDGLDGIRATYSKRRGLKIWFTNGFEKPDDPKRIEIVKQLQKSGLEDVVVDF